MRLNSLAFRLFAAAAAWVLIVLPVAAVILVSLYRDAVERNFDARLNLYLTNLVAGSAADATDRPSPPPPLGEPSFALPFSGWYWQITPVGGDTPLYTSASLLDATLDLPSRAGVAADEANVRQAYAAGPEGQRLRVLEREITLGEADMAYSYAVAGDSAEMEQDIGQFTTMLIAALGVLGVGLVAGTLFQVRFGLAPLRGIRHGLAAIRSGEAEELKGELPHEIMPLQAELNALIRSNRAIVERARTHVGNLAHALKTPLSVIANEARGARGALAEKISQQTEIMRVQIAHHLDRARVAARMGVVGGATEVVPVLDALVRTVQRIHEDRAIAVSASCPEGVKFAGERQDLEEMVGNLLDNACKWARSRVVLTVGDGRDGRDGRDGGDGGDAGPRLTIQVDDDGPGLSEAERRAAVKRGRRLDESKPGSGLGLSIVADLAHLYSGALTLDASPCGGLRARLDLPAA